MKLHPIVRTLIFAGLLLAAGAAPAPAAWVVTEVPVLPAWTGGAEVADINSAGVICGMGNYVINTSSTPFRYDGITVTELPHLPGADVPIALVTGINADGVICGYSHNDEGDSQAVYWEGTTLHTIPYPPDANTNADLRAYDINDSGVIVGYDWNTNGKRTAWYYKDGNSYSLDSVICAAGLPGQQSANGVNDNNVICGTADTAGGIQTPWFYDIDSATLINIGTVGVDDFGASDLNRFNQTIGRGKQNSADKIRAITYDGSWHIVDPTVNVSQWGQGINDKGRMVGHNYLGSSQYEGWYSDGPGDGSMIVLDLPGWTRVRAAAINNKDWIAGYGWSPTSGTDYRGYILKPPPGDANHDGDIDLDDFIEFAGCTSGPQEGATFVSPSTGCLKAFDFAPADGDVDLHDFAAFQRAFENP